MSEPLSAERLRELHRLCSDCYADYCEFDHDEWPCDIIMALDSLETENARLRERAGALAKALAEVFREVVEAALRAYREVTQDETPRPCACAPGNICTCAFDCDCRERDTHIWTMAEGWRNIDGEQETRRDTEA